MKRTLTTLFAYYFSSAAIGCSGGSLTTREKGAGIGALGGAAAVVSSARRLALRARARRSAARLDWAPARLSAIKCRAKKSSKPTNKDKLTTIRPSWIANAENLNSSRSSNPNIDQITFHWSATAVLSK